MGLGGRDAVRGAEAAGADAGGAAMAGGIDADLGAAAMSPMPANGSPAPGAIIVGGGGVGSAAAASGGSGDVMGGGVESNELDGGRGDVVADGPLPLRREGLDGLLFFGSSHDAARRPIEGQRAGRCGNQRRRQP